MRYKLVVFDLDGTLVNSLTDLANAVNFGLEKVSLPAHNVDEYKDFVGNGRDKLIERAMGDKGADVALKNTVKSYFDKYYTEHCNDNTTAYDGCAELLMNLDKNRIMTAVLSNKPDEFVDAILRKIYPDHHFTLAWGRKPQFPEKPNPASLNAIIRELGVQNHECLYIGDSNVDVYTARNASVDVLGVDWGFRGREELVAAGAGVVVSNASEIMEYINEQ